MKILSVTPLALPEVYLLKVARFVDDRGYFTETLRIGDVAQIAQIPYFAQATWHQINESSSQAGVVRGMHVQWNPHMGKLIRALDGTLIDLIMDVRVNSKTFGHIIGYELHYHKDENYQDMVWVPPGFAHGFMALTQCRMEYICTGWWNPSSERALTLYDHHINWSLMDVSMRETIQATLPNAIMAEKDKNGLTLEAWNNAKDTITFMDTLPASYQSS